jgi:RNA ligase (TIGR02306 family)
MRKLVEVVLIEEVKSIPDADLICAYRVMDGWWVVDQVGKYMVGDKVMFAMIDCWIPNWLAPFLSKGKEPREYKGVKGERLRTVKLKKQLSQGLLLPMTVASKEELAVGEDVSAHLGVIKWEPPEEFRSADAKGTLPKFFPKTDEERIQNVYRDLTEPLDLDTWEITEKCEGSSISIYFNNGEYGVCSRNLDLKESDENTFWKTVKKYKIVEKLIALNENIAVQGELIGPGIQGNIYKLADHEIRVFNVFNIDKQEFQLPNERELTTLQLGLQSVPVIGKNVSLTGLTCEELLSMADGATAVGETKCLREGLVFSSMSVHNLSFKTVSNKYLLNEKF